MAIIAYRRVSTVDQKTDRQLSGEEFDKVFEDKASAKDTKRPALEQLLDFVREGDTVVVHSIDRLARNLIDLSQIVQQLNTKGVAVEFRKENLMFDGSEGPLQELMLNMMGSFAQFERAMILERQREGIAAAKAAGKRMGRPGISSKNLKALKAKRKAGVNIRNLQDEFNLSRASVYRLTQ